MDQAQTAPISKSDLGPHRLQYRLHKHFSRREKQTTFVGIGAFGVIIFIMRPKLTWEKLTENDCCAWKLSSRQLALKKGAPRDQV